MPYRVIRRFQESKHGLVEHLDIIIEQGVHFLGVVELLRDRLPDYFHHLFAHEVIRADNIVQGNDLVQMVIAQKLANDIDAPNVSTEREYGLNVRFCGNVAIPVLVATDSDIRNGQVVAHIALKFGEFHLLGTPTGLWRREKTASRFQEVMERCWLRTGFSRP